MSKYQIEITPKTDDQSLLWRRLKYYYNYGALQFNDKIVKECENSDNRLLIPYHFRIGRDINFIETIIEYTENSENSENRIMFDVIGEWNLERLNDILKSMYLVFSDYVGCEVNCVLILTSR